MRDTNHHDAVGEYRGTAVPENNVRTEPGFQVTTVRWIAEVRFHPTDDRPTAGAGVPAFARRCLNEPHALSVASDMTGRLQSYRERTGRRWEIDQRERIAQARQGAAIVRSRA